ISASTINWGDGATSSGPTASHAYSQAGNYTVSATVTDNYGLSATTTKALTISAPSITISSPINGSTVSSPVQVTAKAVSGLPISAIIVYLDGNEVYRTYSATVNTSISMAAGQHQIVTNAWDSAGTLMQAKVSITVKRRR
ncbi:MAG: PKD domain-containing protein, partial [Terriglobales bacterium]